jgi:hypothetical protein
MARSGLNELNNVSTAAMLTVVIPNVAPVAADQSVTTAEDIPLAITRQRPTRTTTR